MKVEQSRFYTQTPGLVNKNKKETKTPHFTSLVWDKYNFNLDEIYRISLTADEKQKFAQKGISMDDITGKAKQFLWMMKEEFENLKNINVYLNTVHSDAKHEKELKITMGLDSSLSGKVDPNSFKPHIIETKITSLFHPEKGSELIELLTKRLQNIDKTVTPELVETTKKNLNTFLKMVMG